MPTILTRFRPVPGILFRHWSTNESVGFELSLGRYLDNVAVGRRHVAGEGAVQCLWAKVTEPWISFDREAVLAYTTSGPEQNPDSAGEIALARTEPQGHGRFETMGTYS